MIHLFVYWTCPEITRIPKRQTGRLMVKQQSLVSCDQVLRWAELNLLILPFSCRCFLMIKNRDCGVMRFHQGVNRLSL
jgi:hypothetical protein